MELKGKGVGSQGYPPRGLGQRPNSTRAKEPARPPRNPNSQQNRRSLQIPAHSPNKEFYQRNLIIFPSAYHDDPSLGVKHHFVPDGVFENGRNPREAAIVV